MPDKKGFTLMEIIAVAMIVGILSAVALPKYNTMMIQGAAQAAQNNLITIYNTQKSYYLSNGSYCIASCDSLAHINTALSLNITDSLSNYTCNNTGGFTCTATNISDTNLILTVTNASIILPGGTGCTASPWVSPCNPACATDVTSYCPNSSL